VARQAGEEGPSEEELAAAEAELEAYQDGLEAMEEEFAEEVERRQAALGGKIDEIMKGAPLASKPAVTIGGSAVGAAGALDRIAVCGILGAGPGEALVARLADEAKGAIFIDLLEAARLPFEKLDELLVNCKALAVCPDLGDDSAVVVEGTKNGLRAILASVPPECTKVLLLSHIGAQAGKGGFKLDSFFGSKQAKWDDIEDELTANCRKRTVNRPLRHVIVRAGSPPASPEAAGAICCMGFDEGPADAQTSTDVVVEVAARAFALEVNSSFSVVGGSGMEKADWNELLLPFVGPEVWRAEVSDPRKAAIFVQGWAEEFFGDGKRAMRMGVKTPVLIRKTDAGVIFKFKPVGTSGDEDFDSLTEGGLEFVAEAPVGQAPRLRARRCAYGWKVVAKENSEKALLDKFAKDWSEVSL